MDARNNPRVNNRRGWECRRKLDFRRESASSTAHTVRANMEPARNPQKNAKARADRAVDIGTLAIKDLIKNMAPKYVPANHAGLSLLFNNGFMSLKYQNKLLLVKES